MMMIGSYSERFWDVCTQHFLADVIILFFRFSDCWPRSVSVRDNLVQLQNNVVFICHCRFSCGSATPVSSDSSDSSPAHEPPPPREPPPALPLDLLTEMEYLFANKNAQRRDSFPNSSHNSEISLPDKAVSEIITL